MSWDEGTRPPGNGADDAAAPSSFALPSPAEAEPRPQRILVVCTANVCRSLLAAALLAETLARVPALAEVEVVSAGVAADPGASFCRISASRIGDDELRERRLATHSAQLLTAQQVGAADLVLTMDREQRSAVNRLVAGRQTSVFTLREAAALAQGLNDRGAPASLRLDAVAERLHALRGQVALPEDEPAPRRLFRRRVVDGDPAVIVDGHTMDAASHEHAADAVRDAALRLGRALGAIAGTRAPTV